MEAIVTRRARTLHEARLHALIAIFVLAFTVIAVASVIGVLGQSGVSSGALKGTDSITSMVSQVWGWNGTTWVAATMTLAPTTYQVTAAFPTGFAVKNVIVATANSSYDNLHLLENSLIFSTSTIKLTLTGGATASLNTAYAYIGSFVNSSATTSFGDKAVNGFVVNETLFAGSTNNLGKAVEYNVPAMIATPANAVPLYTMHLSSVSVNKTQSVSVVMTNYLSYPFAFNIIQIVGGVTLVVALVNLWFVYNAIPKHTRH